MYFQHCYQTRSFICTVTVSLTIHFIHRKYLLSMLFMAEHSWSNHNCSFINRTESGNYVIYCFIIFICTSKKLHKYLFAQHK